MPSSRRRRPRLRSREIRDGLSVRQRAYLLTGVDYTFLDGSAFASKAAAKAGWERYGAELEAECPGEMKPWGRYAFARSAKARQEPGWDVSTHVSHSEYSRPASEHPGYVDALASMLVTPVKHLWTVEELRGMQPGAFRWHPRWVRSWSDVEAVLAGCWFDLDAALHAAKFFRLFTHLEGEWEGQPFELAPWQRFDVVMPLFGWRRRNGTRRFRKALVEIPKKNGKSMLCSVLSLYLLVGDNEASARVYNAAVTRGQAAIVFEEAMKVGVKSQYLGDIIKPTKSQWKIEYLERNGEYKALHADAESQDGFKTSGLVVDELHRHKSRSLWDTLCYGGAARRQPLIVIITTAGEYDPTSIGWEQHDYGRRVLEGGDGHGKDWSFFAYIRCVVEEDTAGADKETKQESERWKDPRWWRRANPGLGTIIKLEEFEHEAREAINQPGKADNFKRLKLNIWVQGAHSLFRIRDWQAGARGPELFDELKGRRCWGGLDLASTIDLCALTLWFPGADDKEPHYCLNWFWLPENNILELQEQHQAPYIQWSRDGFMDLTPGDATDYDAIWLKLLELQDEYQIQTVGFDPHNALYLVEKLQDAGLNMVNCSQSAGAMNAPTKEFHRLMVQHRIIHPGNPVMGWMIGNCMGRFDQHDNVKILKADRKGKMRYKVDGPVSAVMARDCSMRGDDTKGVIPAGVLPAVAF